MKTMHAPRLFDRQSRRSPVLALPFLIAMISGCEAEAVELAQEIHAARGECTSEGLRASDEECIRMMERYAEMGTELVHTYIGGLRTLDRALDRMPPPAFDTVGFGSAISPEFREGDRYGAGASPRLVPSGSASRYSLSPLDGRPTATRGGTAGSSPGSFPLGRRGVGERRAGDDGVNRPSPYRQGSLRSGAGGARERSLYRERRYYEPFGFGASGRWGSGYNDPYRSGFLESGPYGYFYGSPGGYGYGAYDGYGGYGYGLGSGYQNYGYGLGSGYQGYGYGLGSGYGGYGLGGGYPPEFGYGGAYGPGYGAGYGYTDPYSYGAARTRSGYGDPYGEQGMQRDLPPQADWGYEPAYSGDDAPREDPAAAELDPRAAPAPARPAPHRPGILLPPEERLRRPWIDD